jgi:pimeloyl-ACP methyl ester carboxylesterase
VLLHGGGGNSTMFIDNVATLSKHFRIYAIDIIGEAGKSVGARPTKITEYSIWLKEVFDETLYRYLNKLRGDKS